MLRVIEWHRPRWQLLAHPWFPRDVLWQGNKDTLYRIHGTVEPWTIGKSVSSGCIRMINQDVIDLYQRTPVGARVVVLSECPLLASGHSGAADQCQLSGVTADNAQACRHVR